MQRRRGGGGAWMVALVVLLGCGAVGLALGYVLLTDPAAEMLALREGERPTGVGARVPDEGATPLAVGEAAPVPTNVPTVAVETAVAATVEAHFAAGDEAAAVAQLTAAAAATGEALTQRQATVSALASTAEAMVHATATAGALAAKAGAQGVQGVPESAPQPAPQAPAPQSDGPAPGGPEPPQGAAPPPLPPTDVLRGDVRWTPARGPVFVQRNIMIPAGSRLTIEPGTEVRIDVGVSIMVEGQLIAAGRPEAFVRILPLSPDSRQRWEGIFGSPGSVIALDSSEVRGGGSGGTLIASKGDALRPSALVIRGSRFVENGGQILAADSRLELRDNEISSNELPYGAAVNATYEYGNQVLLVGNRIVGNRLGGGVPGVSIANTNRFAGLGLLVQRNLIINTNDNTNLVLSAHAPIQGTVSCNTLRGGSLGLDIRGEARQVPGFDLQVYDNTLDDHTPPVVPVYLDYGIGRGAASEVALRMFGNWWGDRSGPYHPESNPEGRGDAVGENIEYAGWLDGPPGCAPPP